MQQLRRPDHSAVLASLNVHPVRDQPIHRQIAQGIAIARRTLRIV